MLISCVIFFFFNDTATTEIYTLSLHDALPIFRRRARRVAGGGQDPARRLRRPRRLRPRRGRSGGRAVRRAPRSEEHTSELRSRQYIVCRLLLEKKKKELTSVRTQVQHITLHPD